MSVLAERGASPRPEGVVRANDPRNVLLHELTRAADGAGRIAAGPLKLDTKFRRYSRIPSVAGH